MTNYVVAETIKTGIGNIPGDLSNINISSLGILDGDIAVVDNIYNYKWDAASTDTETIPKVVKGYYNSTGRWILKSKRSFLRNLIVNSEFNIFSGVKWLQTLASAIAVTAVSNGTVTTSAAHNLVIGELVAIGVDAVNNLAISPNGIWIDCSPDGASMDNLTMFEVTSIIDSTHFTVDSPDFTAYVAADSHSFRQILLYGTDFYQCINNVASAPDPPDSNYSKLVNGLNLYPCCIVTNDAYAILLGMMIARQNDGISHSGIYCGRVQSLPDKIIGKSGGVLNSTGANTISFNFISQNLNTGNAFINKFVGKRLTLGCYLQGVNAYLELWSDTGGSVTSTPNADSTVAWHEITIDVPADANEFAAGVKAVSTANTDMFFWSKPILVEDDFIGEGNYVEDHTTLTINKVPIPFKTFSWTKTFSTMLSFSLNYPRETFYSIARGAVTFGFSSQISRVDTTGVPVCSISTNDSNEFSLYPDLAAGDLKHYMATLGNNDNNISFSITLNGVASVTMYAGISFVSYG